MLSMVMFSHIVPVNLHCPHGTDVCEAAGVWVVDGGSSLAPARGIEVLAEKPCTSGQCGANNTNFCKT
jgi:hypothetical protein